MGKQVSWSRAAFGRGVVAFSRSLAEIAGGAVEGLFLSQAYYLTERVADADGWFYHTIEQWEADTALTRREQERCRKALKDLGLLEEKREGLPAKMHFRLVVDRIEALLLAPDRAGGVVGQLGEQVSGKSSLHEVAQLDRTGSPTLTQDESMDVMRYDLVAADAPNNNGESGGTYSPIRQTLQPDPPNFTARSAKHIRNEREKVEDQEDDDRESKDHDPPTQPAPVAPRERAGARGRLQGNDVDAVLGRPLTRDERRSLMTREEREEDARRRFAARSEDEQEVLTALCAIPGFPADEGFATTARLRKVQEAVPRVNLIHVAQSYRDSRRTKPPSWGIFEQWAKRVAERHGLAQEA